MNKEKIERQIEESQQKCGVLDNKIATDSSDNFIDEEKYALLE